MKRMKRVIGFGYGGTDVYGLTACGKDFDAAG